MANSVDTATPTPASSDSPMGDESTFLTPARLKMLGIGVAIVAVAVQQFEKVVELYGGTSSAHEATLGMAQARLVAGQNELAISTLEEFLKSNPPATYASPANGLLGTGYENVGRYDDAVAAYQQAADESDIGYLKAILMLDAGRSAKLAGKPDDARAIYEKIIADYGETPARSEAEVRLSEITAKTA